MKYLVLLFTIVLSCIATNNDGKCALELIASKLFPKDQDINIVLTLPNIYNNVSIIYVFMDTTTSQPEFENVVTNIAHTLAIQDTQLLVVTIGPTVSITTILYIFNNHIVGAINTTVLAVIAFGAQNTERAAAGALSYVVYKRGIYHTDCTHSKISPILFTTDLPSVSRLNSWVIPFRIQLEQPTTMNSEESFKHIVNINAMTGFSDTIASIPSTFLTMKPNKMSMIIINIPDDCPAINERILLAPFHHAFDDASVILTIVTNLLIKSRYLDKVESVSNYVSCSSIYDDDCEFIPVSRYCEKPYQDRFTNYITDIIHVGFNIIKKIIYIVEIIVNWMVMQLFNKKINLQLTITIVTFFISVTALLITLKNKKCENIHPTERIHDQCLNTDVWYTRNGFDDDETN